MTRLLAPVLFVTFLLAAWEAACRALHVPAYLLPAPSAVAQALVEAGPLLASSAWGTLSTALAGLVLAALVALAIAFAAALRPVVEDAFAPVAAILQVTPVIAIAPLVTIWAGIDHPGRAVTALAAVIAFFPIYSGAVAGLKAADPDLSRLFDLYGATPWQRLVRLRLPSALPALLEGLKVAAGLALVGAVAAEFVAGSGSSQGLAWRMLESFNRLQTARGFAALAVLALMGVAVHAALAGAERRLLAWWRGR
ncbi:ABC transporter permease [Caulobacter hibisci]|uniref:ABC transporter permease n=1 Tax=Caulobacter hibisci TaxID=2035993 RepID=A0ABS0T223_9CAUL|nr:ABC transporter permease [Caulobacter hibisci]MBI1685869.1 ABC transporter permease [Caulobacter hibisci]